MVDTYLREHKERALSTLATHCPAWLHPTMITVVAFIVGVGAAWVIAQGWYLVGLILWWLNRLLDGLDGTVARITLKQSDFGGYLDIVLDTAMYAAIPIALAYRIGTTEAYLALAFLLTMFYINGSSWMYLAAILEKRERSARAKGELTSVTMPSGLLEGTETVLFFSLFLLFPSAIVPLFVAMGILTIFTFVPRIVWAARTL